MSILRISLVLLQFIFMVIGAVYLLFSKDLPKIETITEIRVSRARAPRSRPSPAKDC